MSVILRRGDDIILYCKGADNVIYDRLSTSQNDNKARTQDHLNVSFRLFFNCLKLIFLTINVSSTNVLP